MTLTFKPSIYSTLEAIGCFSPFIEKIFFFPNLKFSFYFKLSIQAKDFLCLLEIGPSRKKKWKILFNIFSCFLMLPTLKANFFDRQKAFFPLIDGKVESNEQKSFILILKKEKLKKFERRKLVLNYTLSLVSSYFFSTFYCQF